jgi:hypothetical protein
MGEFERIPKQPRVPKGEPAVDVHVQGAETKRMRLAQIKELEARFQALLDVAKKDNEPPSEINKICIEMDKVRATRKKLEQSFADLPDEDHDELRPTLH